MFHKYNSFTNTLTPTDQISSFIPQSFGTEEATNNYFVAPQPKGRQPGGSGPDGAGSLAGRQLSLFSFLTNRSSAKNASVAATAHSVTAAASQAAATLTQGTAAKVQSLASAASQAAATLTHETATKAQSVAAAASQAATAITQAATTSSHGASKAVQSHGHGHGHGSHAGPWEGVNLWRTPYKGDADTITQVKRSKGTLDQYVESRTRQIQQLQLYALRNKTKPTWVMMPRDKVMLAVQGLLVGYVIYQVTTTVYQHLKAKDRLKLLKLLYKDNVD